MPVHNHIHLVFLCQLYTFFYEICNEPKNGTSWKEIKSYAKSVISTIRENDKKAVIVVGTPTWSQDVDQAAADPIKGENLMYALHFYAATQRQTCAIK